MLTYTITTSRNQFHKIPEQNRQFQIMPVRTGFVRPDFKVPSHSNLKSHILLHTGYDINPFSPSIFNPADYQALLLKSYLDACPGVDELLIHGPDKPSTLRYFDAGLTIIKTYSESVPEIKIGIEMPAFCKSMYSEGIVNQSNAFDFALSYFNNIIKFGFEIIIDTAHLFSNGLTTSQICDLLTIFKDNYTYIHLNGNANSGFKKDKHTTLTPHPNFPQNQIPDADQLLSCVAALMNEGKICISEQKCSDLNYFKHLSTQFGFKINEGIPSELII